MKHILIYFPYALLKNPKSGSGVRPKKMVQAFKEYGRENGLDVIIISGKSAERKKLIKDYKSKNMVKDAVFCYMENSTMPYWLTDEDHMPRNLFSDLAFWRYLKKHHLPIGLFYRDVYWKFDEMYAPPRDKKVLTPIMRFIYKRELSAFAKVVDTLYLPSLEMNKFVEWRGQYDELPPGMENVEQGPQADKAVPKAVFVGGINDQKGMLMMLNAFTLLNHEQEVQLEIICREDEYRKYPEMHAYSKYPWLTVSHRSGEDLKTAYAEASIALIPREINTYHDFSVPVKMFEYLAHGLPIVATDCKAQSRILSKEGAGFVTEDTAESFAEGVRKAIEKNAYEKLTARAKAVFLTHSWKSRAEKVAVDLEQLNPGGAST